MNKEQQLIYNELVSKYNFNKEQKFQIEVGLQKNLDVSWYAKPEYHWLKMQTIRMGLEKGLNVSIYANPKLTWKKMDLIRKGLEKGLYVTWYANQKYTLKQMEKIYFSLQTGTFKPSFLIKIKNLFKK